MKIRVGIALILLVSASYAVAAEPKPGADDRPNVLFIFADDQRADTIAALGNPVIKTPTLDRLCQQGLAFRRAYMQGAFNAATCVPSRAMLLSGQSLFHADEQLLRGESWPAAFGRAGYTTFISGKWHNGDPSLPRCFQHARAIVGGMGDPMHIGLRDLKNGRLVKRPHPAGQHACAIISDEAIRFLREHRAKDGPFFCYLPYDAPHDPHIVPADFPVRYEPAKLLLPSNFLPQHPFDNGEMRIRDEGLLPHPRSPQAIRKMLADYYRYVSYLDMQIGRVLDTLEQSPFARNTIVVFTADSGVARGSHGLIGKQNLYEHSIRVPLIVAGPGIPAGKTTDALCYLYDVLPTLGAMCGVSAPPKSNGLDLSAVWRDPSRPGRMELVFAYKGVQRAVAIADWKFIWYPKVNQNQLFNLREDPDETHNLAGRPAHADRQAEMFVLLKQKLADAGDNDAERGDRNLTR